MYNEDILDTPQKKNNTFPDLSRSMSGVSDPSDYDDSGIV